MALPPSSTQPAREVFPKERDAERPFYIYSGVEADPGCWASTTACPTLSRTQTAQVSAVTTEIPSHLDGEVTTFIFAPGPHWSECSVGMHARPGSVSRTHSHPQCPAHSHTHSQTHTMQPVTTSHQRLPLKISEVEVFG